ncbi:Potassium voltage-gated channel subfamily G member 2 [Mactra antiquata]
MEIKLQTGSSKIRLNVGGTHFETFNSTLKTFPESKLAHLSKHTNHFDSEKNEYFFDRNPILFAFILDAYRKEEIHLPSDICGPTFRKELEFWELSLSHVAPCCWEALYKSDDDVKTVNKLMDNYKKNAHFCMTQDNLSACRKRLWMFLEDPHSSYFAMAWVTFMSILVIAAIVAEMMASLTDFKEEFSEKEKQALDLILDMHGDINNETAKRIYAMKPNRYLSLTVTCCHAILTFEFIISFIVCPIKRDFILNTVRTPLMFGYICFWVTYSMEKYFLSLGPTVMLVYVICKYGTIFKIARLFYLSKYVPALKVVGLTFAASISELKILVFLLGVLVCAFGKSMYSLESIHNDDMNNLFATSYWALITLTTVGYGDMIPNTKLGHVVAALCAVCGIIVLALPIGIIASTFNKLYNFNSYVITHVRRNKDVLSDSKIRKGTDNAEKDSDGRRDKVYNVNRVF